MNIRLIDVDSHNFPNLPLMKLSAYHKMKGDHVEWYDPLTEWQRQPDIVYMAKVFSFTEDYMPPVVAKKIVHGGTGYYYPDGGEPLPEEIEHIYPDYSLYPALTQNTAFGFLTRGCPRGCGFCVVGEKEGRKSVKVAELSEFWRGQKYIELLDPNMFACKDWKALSEQLIDSKAYINFNQSCDIRIMNEEMAETIKKMKIKQIHFAWDRYEDKEKIVPKFKLFQEITGWKRGKMSVYVLVGYGTTFEQDLERVYTLIDLGYSPYVMIYDKYKKKAKDPLVRLQRWVNARLCYSTCKKFEDYVS